MGLAKHSLRGLIWISLFVVAYVSASVAMADPVKTISSTRSSAQSKSTENPRSTIPVTEQTKSVERTVDGLILPSGSKLVSGFQMEGNPVLDTVFADAEGFTKKLEDLERLASKMEDARQRFSARASNMRQLIDGNAECNASEATLAIENVDNAVRAFQKQGADFEREALTIGALTKLGESKGLPPDYRAKAHRVPEMYRRALVDLRELRITLSDHLHAEWTRRCKKPRRIRLAKISSVTGKAISNSPRLQKKRDIPNKRVQHENIVEFLIDNTGCDQPIDVFIDGNEAGHASANENLLLETTKGRHSLCLTNKGKPCGAPGTQRTAHIHEGFSTTIHCKVTEE